MSFKLEWLLSNISECVPLALKIAEFMKQFAIWKKKNDFSIQLLVGGRQK